MNNLFEFTSELKNRIKGWAKTVIKEMKNALSLGTQNSELKNEVGKYIALDTASGLTENGKWVVKAFTAMLEKLKYERKFDLISEDEYYAGLERLRDRYFKKGTQNWVKYTQEIYAYQKKALEQEKESIVSLYGDISKYAADRLNDVLKKQAEFSEKLKDASGLFNKNTVKIGNREDTFYSMRNLEQDIENIRRYQQLIEDFKSRAESLGISDEISDAFLKELKSEDFYASLSLLTYMQNSEDRDILSYLSAWDERNRLADAIAAKTYEAEFSESVSDAYENMKNALMQAGYEIPEGFFVSGSLSAQRFGDAFVAEIETQMERIRAIIDAFNSEIAAYSEISGGVTYNTSNISYNISSANADDTVEKIRRYETVKRLAGI